MRLYASLTSLAILASLAKAQIPATYRVVELRSLTGDTYTYAACISRNGNYIGGYSSGSGARAVSWTSVGAPTALPPGFTGSEAAGVSNSASFAGTTADGTGGRRMVRSSTASIWSFSYLTAPPGAGSPVCGGESPNARYISGYFLNGSGPSTMVRYDGTILQVLPPPPSVRTNYLHKVSDTGVAVGYYADTSSFFRGFSWNGTAYRLLQGIAGFPHSQAIGINNAGIMAGCVWDASNKKRGALWQPTGATTPFTTVNPLAGDTSLQLFAINGQSLAVGYSGGATTRPIVSAGTLAYDLTTRLDSTGAGWTLYQANDISDNGLIVGLGTHFGQNRAFLLIPNWGP
jgi:hypothetical protein